MSDQPSELKSEYIDKLRRLKLLEAGVDYDEIDTYTKYITTDNIDEIVKQATELVADIKQQSRYGDVYIDERTWRPFK